MAFIDWLCWIREENFLRAAYQYSSNQRDNCVSWGQNPQIDISYWSYWLINQFFEELKEKEINTSCEYVSQEYFARLLDVWRETRFQTYDSAVKEAGGAAHGIQCTTQRQVEGEPFEVTIWLNDAVSPAGARRDCKVRHELGTDGGRIDSNMHRGTVEKEAKQTTDQQGLPFHVDWAADQSP